MNKKGFSPIIIGIIFAAVFVVGAGGYLVVKSRSLSMPSFEIPQVDEEITDPNPTEIENVILESEENNNITLFSPNGEEEYKVGEVINVQWEPGEPGIWEIDLVNTKNNEVTLLYFLGDPMRPPGDTTGSKSITIPMSVEPGDYYIRIYTAKMPYEVGDKNDKPFTVLESNNIFLEIVSPSGGETWKAGTTNTISWQYNNEIESLGYDNFSIMAVSVKYPNSRRKAIATFKKSIFEIPTFFNWEIPWNISLDDYKIEISYTTCGSSDCGGVFFNGYNYVDKSGESIHISSSTVENFLTISNRQSSPIAGDVYPGDRDIEFFSFDLKAPSTEKATLTMLEIGSENSKVFAGIENPRIVTPDEQIIKLIQFNEYYIDNPLWVLENPCFC